VGRDRAGYAMVREPRYRRASRLPSIFLRQQGTSSQDIPRTNLPRTISYIHNTVCSVQALRHKLAPR
jgi:hypothetical protein